MTRTILLIFALAGIALAAHTDTACFPVGAGSCVDIMIPQTPSPIPTGAPFTGTVPTRCSIGRLWSTGSALCVCTAKDVWSCVAVATTTTTSTTTVTTTSVTTTT